MPDADVAAQLQHVTLLEHVTHETVVLAHEQLALVRSHDAGGILAPVLQHRQRVIDLLVGCREPDDPTMPHMHSPHDGCTASSTTSRLVST
jgi:hypothetical protein